MCATTVNAVTEKKFDGIFARSRFRKSINRNTEATNQIRFSANSVVFLQKFIELKAQQISRAAAIITASSQRKTIKASDILAADSSITGTPFDTTCVTEDPFKENKPLSKKRKAEEINDENDKKMNFSRARLRKIITSVAGSFRISSSAAQALDLVLSRIIKNVMDMIHTCINEEKKKILSETICLKACQRYNLEREVYPKLSSTTSVDSDDTEDSVATEATVKASSAKKSSEPAKKKKKKKKTAKKKK